MVENVIIMGAAGRDFHNFNVYFRDNKRYNVAAFTATQIPDIDGRKYPAEIAGELYPDGIPIYPEEQLAELIRKYKIDLVVFSYSDVTHLDVMHKASISMAEGADFIIIGAPYTMIESKKPVISVCAVRTGCGKSQTTRKVCKILQGWGLKPSVVRHPMPYGDLTAQIVQRFTQYEDFDKHECTIEEREEYEPLVDQGITVFAGVDYGKILAEAEKEGDVVVWDGGNNDTSFFLPDVQITVFDPHRPGHELLYFPGETNMIMADIAVVNKVDTAPKEGIDVVCGNIEKHAPKAVTVMAESPPLVENGESLKGKRVLVVEDGPTLTHGGMAYGAGVVAAKAYGVAEIVDPKPHVVESIAATFEKYPQLSDVIPAMGYSKKQRDDLEQSIRNVDCDVVLFATPIDLTRIITIDKPTVRVRYEYKDQADPKLEDILKKLWDERIKGKKA